MRLRRREAHLLLLEALKSCPAQETIVTDGLFLFSEKLTTRFYLRTTTDILYHRYEREGDDMTTEEKKAERCRAVLYLLPDGLQEAAARLSAEEQAAAEEFRLRIGRPLSLLEAEGERELPTRPVTQQDLKTVLDRATEFSVYRCADSIRAGYVTVEGGCRIGLCGTAIQRRGEILTIRELSSLAIRIARAVPGAAGTLYPQLWEDGVFCSTLIIAPPGGGKTTMLRDLIRCLSNGSAEHPALRLAVVDERGEVGAVCRGAAQFDLGRHTDILTGTAKTDGIFMLLRTMNPQVIAVDEITDSADIRAMSLAANCGVSFLATVHGRDLSELRRRSICRELLAAQLFTRAAVLETCRGQRRCRLERC